jgi:hypothetical protein
MKRATKQLDFPVKNPYTASPEGGAGLRQCDTSPAVSPTARARWPVGRVAPEYLLLVHLLQYLYRFNDRPQGSLPLAPLKLSQTTIVSDAIEPGRKARLTAK